MLVSVTKLDTLVTALREHGRRVVPLSPPSLSEIVLRTVRRGACDLKLLSGEHKCVACA